jgi:hypothetical protein
MTGWNLPPGCTDADIDRAFGGDRQPSALAEDVRALLEKARIGTRTVEAIMEMIAEEEDEANEPDPDDLRDARADYEYDRDR